MTPRGHRRYGKIPGILVLKGKSDCTKLNAFLRKTRRTITDIDMMVLTNLVENAIGCCFCFNYFFTFYHV